MTLPQMAYNPDPASWGSVSPRPRGHKHVMSIFAWTTSGPLKVLTTCLYCSKGDVIKPSKRIRNIPEPFTPQMWAEFLEKGRIRDEQLKQEAV